MNLDEISITHYKFSCEQCGDRYVFVEMGDYPRYCPTCGHEHE